jgi:hypothetical protein
MYNVRRYGEDQRDYREGWPLLIVKTDVNGNSKSTNERGPSLLCTFSSPGPHRPASWAGSRAGSPVS